MGGTTGNNGMGEGTPRGALLKIEDVAAVLGCGRTYAYRLIATNSLRSIKLGKLRRVRPEDLARYLDALAEDQHP
jgi:excisionase family DNA binding protein